MRLVLFFARSSRTSPPTTAAAADRRRRRCTRAGARGPGQRPRGPTAAGSDCAAGEFRLRNGGRGGRGGVRAPPSALRALCTPSPFHIHENDPRLTPSIRVPRPSLPPAGTASTSPPGGARTCTRSTPTPSPAFTGRVQSGSRSTWRPAPTCRDRSATSSGGFRRAAAAARAAGGARGGGSRARGRRDSRTGRVVASSGALPSPRRGAGWCGRGESARGENGSDAREMGRRARLLEAEGP